MKPWVELEATSNFSFLRGASHPQELVTTAYSLGYRAIALTDCNTLSGVVLAHTSLKNCTPTDTRLIVGCRLELNDGFSLLCYPKDRNAYGRLTRLLTLGRRRAEKGKCDISFDEVLNHGEGQKFIFPCPKVLDVKTRANIDRCHSSLGPNFYLALTNRFQGIDDAWFDYLSAFAISRRISLVVTNDVAYHEPNRKMLLDVLTCIRENCTLHEAGFRLDANAEHFLRVPHVVYRLYKKWPKALQTALDIAEESRFSLDELRYQYPFELSGLEMSAYEDLERRTLDGAAVRYSNGLSADVRTKLIAELNLIRAKDYAPYFLTVHDIVKFAKEANILCQGRGSAANSLVCYCLGITEVDPIVRNLLFERFISASRNEPPDIDIDFEHERREEIIQHIYKKYGRDRAGIIATVVHYRTRRAVREVSKVFGLSDDVIRSITGSVKSWSNDGVKDCNAREAGFDPTDRRIRLVLDLSRQLIGFPRHLSQHTGGFVLSQTSLEEFVPVENAAMEDRTIVQWDKDDIDELGMMKVDILGLGMLTAIKKAFSLLNSCYGKTYTLSNFPKHDDKVFAMLQEADSIGVFQVESRAQQSMLPRLKPKEFYDLVIEVAIVRPGPIQGNMVHPYLKRREQKEQVVYPSDELRKILEKTLGVPLFQEQAMQIAITAAKFAPSEADDLRRSLATFRHNGKISTFKKRFVNGMVKNNYPLDFAKRCFKQIEGFGTYGFPESHAISFANLVWISAWIKFHYPDVFCAALLNSQPMGFYSPSQLIADARNHGVEVRTVDVNYSDWDCTLEKIENQNRYALRLGFRMVKGLVMKTGIEIVKHRGRGYQRPIELAIRAGCDRDSFEKLARADAFGSLNLSRRKSLWLVSALDNEVPPLFQKSSDNLFLEKTPELSRSRNAEEVLEDCLATGVTLRKHPVAFLRPEFEKKCVLDASKVKKSVNGEDIIVAGIVLFRQQPGTAKGTIFLSLEDETGIINIIVWKNITRKYRRVVYTANLLACQGLVQRQGKVIHVVAQQLWDWSKHLSALNPTNHLPELPVVSRDFR